MRFDYVWKQDEDVDSCVVQQRSGEDVVVSVTSPDEAFKFYAVYDGHGVSNPHGEMDGRHVSSVLANGYKKFPPLHSYLKFHIKQLKEKKVKNIKEALKFGVFSYDLEMSKRDFIGGSCGCIVLILTSQNREKELDRHIFTINLGDSRACILDLRRSNPIIYKTRDHSPLDSYESERINKCGVPVRQGRVYGSLSVSRAFGDWSYKKQEQSSPVIAIPSVKYHFIPAHDSDHYRFMISSDGLYESGINCEYIIQVLQNLQIIHPGNVTPKLIKMIQHTTTDDISLVYSQI